MNILDSFDKGWQYTKRHGVILSLLLVAIYMLFNYLTLMCFPEDFWEKYTSLASSGTGNMVKEFMKLAPYFEQASIKIWLVYFLQYLVIIGVLNIALTVQLGETKRVNLKYLSLPLRTYFKVIQFGCIMMLVLMFSLYLAFIPYIYIGIRTMFVLPLFLEDPDADFGIAVKASLAMTRGNFFSLLSFYLLCILVLIIGACVFLVGIFPAFVVCIFAFLSLYNEGKSRLAKLSHL